MTAYLIRRAAVAVLMLLGVATVTFLLIHSAPGDPADLYVSKEMDAPERAAVLAAFGLGRPLPEQYLRWIAGAARGELGWSFSHRRPVVEVMKERLPLTLELTLTAFLLHLVLGVAAGAVAALRRGSMWDALSTGGALVSYSVPSFWLAALMILWFAIHLGWLPSSGVQELVAPTTSLASAMADRARHLALPATCLALGSAACTARFVRAGLLSALSQEYALAARARGAREGTVVLRHALSNALLPVITLSGMTLPFLFGGSVLVETVFSWPGMGSLSVEAVFTRDYPVAMATQLLLAFMVVAGSFAADVGLALADPRLRAGWRP
jgi:peptide/nickel transport system permease protein